MQYSEAFAQLGYDIDAPRIDWSAEKADGVCISLWESEMGYKDGRPWIDTHCHCSPNENWRNKPGNKKRIRHIQRAMEEFKGRVDVVIVQGVPGHGVKDASPWLPEERRGYRWIVTDLDADRGHFMARAIDTEG